MVRAYAGKLFASPSLLLYISLSAASENKTLTKPPASSKSVPQVSQLKNNRTELSEYLSAIISARNACNLLNFDMNVNFDLLQLAIGRAAQAPAQSARALDNSVDYSTRSTRGDSTQRGDVSIFLTLIIVYSRVQV